MTSISLCVDGGFYFGISQISNFIVRSFLVTRLIGTKKQLIEKKGKYDHTSACINP
jgi:hypothetical protein